MHPQIIRIMKNQIKLAKSDLIVLDTPLLIEAGLKDLVDKLIVVKAKRSQQIERIIKKSSLSKEEILKRIKNQIPLQVKVRWADFVIDNSGTIANTRKQVKTVWRSLVPTLGRDSGLICKPVITGKLRRLLWKN